MRIHTGGIAVCFCFFVVFQLSRVEYAVLLLTFALVMMAELVNTAIERLCDKTARSTTRSLSMQRIWRRVRFLVCAVFAVGWQSACLEIQRCTRLFGAGFEPPVGFVLFLVFSLLSVVYIIAGPPRIGLLTGKKKRGGNGGDPGGRGSCMELGKQKGYEMQNSMIVDHQNDRSAFIAIVGRPNVGKSLPY